MIDASQFPDVPAEAGTKRLYVAENLSEANVELLKAKNWLVQDVRLMPNKTDSDRADIVKAWLEGIRQGSIAPSRQLLDFIELEAKICGLLNQKQIAQAEKVDTSEMDIDTLLSFNSSRAKSAVGQNKTKAPELVNSGELKPKVTISKKALQSKAQRERKKALVSPASVNILPPTPEV